MPKKADGVSMTVEDAIAAARIKQSEGFEPTPDAVKTFVTAGPLPPDPAPDPEGPEDLEGEQLDARFNELFAAANSAQELLETSMDPDGTLTFNMGGMADGPNTIIAGPLILLDDANLPPSLEELVDDAFEPELPVDWERLSEATKAEIAAGRAALGRRGR